MGTAIADMNNDGWQDIITPDMLPADEKTLKSSDGDDPLDIYDFQQDSWIAVTEILFNPVHCPRGS